MAAVVHLITLLEGRSINSGGDWSCPFLNGVNLAYLCGCKSQLSLEHVVLLNGFIRREILVPWRCRELQLERCAEEV